MGVVEGFKGAGLFVKIAFVLLLIAALFSWISFTNTGWGRTDTGVSNSDNFIGLWRLCSNSKQVTGCSLLDGIALDWMVATQTFVSLGFMGLNIGLVFLLLYMFLPSCQKNGELGMASALVCIVTGVLYFIGVVVFAAKFKEDYIDPVGSTWELGYAFALSVIAFVLEIVAGVLILVECKKGGTSPSA